jgi:hypothetical protein
VGGRELKKPPKKNPMFRIFNDLLKIFDSKYVMGTIDGDHAPKIASFWTESGRRMSRPLGISGRMKKITE